MADGEVSRLLARLGRLRLQIVGTFAEMVVVQFLLEGLISGLGEHRLFLKNGEDTHRLCYEKKKKQRNPSESVTSRFAFSKSSVIQMSSCFSSLIICEHISLNRD